MANDYDKYLSTFLGFGNKNPKYLFIGMEFGGDKIDKFLRAWEESGSCEFVDAKEFHDLIGDRRWFHEGKIQRTYGKLIRAIPEIAINNEISNKQIKDFQINEFGKACGNNSFIELSAFPCKAINSSEQVHSTIGIAKKQYLEKYLPLRINRITKIISEMNNSIIIIYGRTESYVNPLLTELKISLTPIECNHGKLTIKKSCLGTNLVLHLEHPANWAQGVNNKYFDEVRGHIKAWQNANK